MLSCLHTDHCVNGSVQKCLNSWVVMDRLENLKEDTAGVLLNVLLTFL